MTSPIILALLSWIVLLQIMARLTISSAEAEPASRIMSTGLSKVAATFAFSASLLPGLYTGPSADILFESCAHPCMLPAI